MLAPCRVKLVQMVAYIFSSWQTPICSMKLSSSCQPIEIQTSAVRSDHCKSQECVQMIFWKTSAPHRPSSHRPPQWSRSGGSWPASAPACGCKSPPRHWSRPEHPSGVSITGARQSEVFPFVYLVLDRDKLSVLADQAELAGPSVCAGAIHHSGGVLVPEAPVAVEVQTVSMSFKVVILWILSHNTVYRS